MSAFAEVVRGIQQEFAEDASAAPTAVAAEGLNVEEVVAAARTLDAAGVRSGHAFLFGLMVGIRHERRVTAAAAALLGKEES